MKQEVYHLEIAENTEEVKEVFAFLAEKIEEDQPKLTRMQRPSCPVLDAGPAAYSDTRPAPYSDTGKRVAGDCSAREDTVWIPLEKKI